MKILLRSAALVGAAVALAGCGSSSHSSAPPAVKKAAVKATCAYRAGWQSLANKLGTDVYCPGWLPDPLTSQIKGQWNSMDQVNAGTKKSYVESFIWQDTDTPGISGVLHVILRGWPHQTKIPTCLAGLNGTTPTPCFGGARGTVVGNDGMKARIYTVNQDFDNWHIALLWRHEGTLYTISEHLAVPVDTLNRVVGYLTHEFRSLVLIEPTHAT